MADSVTGGKKINAAAFIEEAGMTRFAVAQLILIILCGVVEGFVYMLVPYTMSQVAAEWELSSVATGSLSSWVMVGCIIGGLVGGVISDKFGRRMTMIVSVLLMGVLTVPVALSPDYGVFAALRLLSGLAVGSECSIKVSMASENSTIKRRTLVTSIACSATPFGYICASLASMAIVPTFGWRPLFYTAGVGIILAVVLIMFLKETPYWALSNGRLNEACDYLNKVRVSSGSKTPEITVDMIETPPVVARQKISYGILFSNKKMAKITIGATLIYFCAMSTLYGINSWYPSLMMDKGVDIVSAYGFSLAMNFAGCIGNIVAGALLQALGRRNGEVFGFAISIIFVLFMAFFSGGPAIMATSAILVGFAINYLPSSVNGVTPELFPTNARGSGISFVMSTGRIAGMLAPIVAGFLLELGMGFTGLISTFATPCVVGIIFVFIFMRDDNKNKTLDEVESE